MGGNNANQAKFERVSKMLNYTENAQVISLSPKGCNVNYVITSELCGVVKVGRSANLWQDFRAAKRYYPDATLVAVKFQASKPATKAFEALMASLVKPFKRANGKATEVYPISKLKEILKGF